MQHQKREMRGHPSIGGLPGSKPDVLSLSRKGPLGEMLHTGNAKGKSRRRDPARNTVKGKNATTTTPSTQSKTRDPTPKTSPGEQAAKPTAKEAKGRETQDVAKLL